MAAVPYGLHFYHSQDNFNRIISCVIFALSEARLGLACSTIIGTYILTFPWLLRGLDDARMQLRKLEAITYKNEIPAYA